MENNDYTTYYIKTNCEHCGEDVVIRMYSKVPVINATREYEVWKDFRDNQQIDFKEIKDE